MGKHDVEFFQIVIYFTLVQRLAIAHRLVITGSLGDFLGVFHLHLDIETAESLSVRTSFLHKDVVADSLVERAYLNSFFRLGIPKFVNLDAENRFEEGFGNLLMAKHHSKHESVCNGELFKRCAFIFHFDFTTGTRRFSRIENRPYLYTNTPLLKIVSDFAPF